MSLGSFFWFYGICFLLTFKSGDILSTKKTFSVRVWTNLFKNSKKKSRAAFSIGSNLTGYCYVLLISRLFTAHLKLLPVRSSSWHLQAESSMFTGTRG